MPIPIVRPPAGNTVAGNQTARFEWLVLAVEAIIQNQAAIAAVVEADKAIDSETLDRLKGIVTS